MVLIVRGHMYSKDLEFRLYYEDEREAQAQSFA